MQKRLSAKTTLATGTAMAMIVLDVLLLFPAQIRILRTPTKINKNISKSPT